MDGRTDIYSLEATFYHLVTGFPPFHGSSGVEVMFEHVRERLPDPRDVRAGIPEGVAHVIRRMMAKRPEDRHGGCGELLEDLERVARGLPPGEHGLGRGTVVGGAPAMIVAVRTARPRRGSQAGTVERRKAVDLPAVRVESGTEREEEAAGKLEDLMEKVEGGKVVEFLLPLAGVNDVSPVRALGDLRRLGRSDPESPGDWW